MPSRIVKHCSIFFFVICKKQFFKTAIFTKLRNVIFVKISRITGKKSSVDGEKLIKIGIHNFRKTTSNFAKKNKLCSPQKPIVKTVIKFH